MSELVGQLGAKLYYSSPESHDLAVSFISYLPIMVSPSLITACMEESDSKVLELLKALLVKAFVTQVA
ncbi:prephenate dehydrogenase [Richelia intracellularis HM01]|nr:prephenate dehydrogenase [Richelia intracellularis HM01]